MSPAFARVASMKDVAKRDFVLAPSRYVGGAERDDDGEPFERKLAFLAGELSGPFAKKSH
jgi:type I restriction enzyme M protein